MNKAKFSQFQNSPIQEKFTVNKLKEVHSSAEKENFPEEMELFYADKTLKDLILKIEQSNARVHFRKFELLSLGNSTNGAEDPQHEELMQKFDGLKQELSKLKIDVSSALESKAKAEKDIEVYNLKESSSLRRVEELKKEIEKANEEHVLVELARIEAEKELKEIESQRAAEAMEFSKKMEETKKKISELRVEISRAMELEEKLAATNTDISVLQNEMELLRAMEKNFSIENSKKKIDLEQLEIVENEIRKAKKELESIKDEGFEFMASMDIVRAELQQISKETGMKKKMEKNAESTIVHLNSKLMKAKSKLESDTFAEERSRGIISNLSTALQQLETEVETAKEEKKKANKETSNIKQEIEKTEMDIKSTQKKLLDNIPKLEKVKALEAAALLKLKNMVENMVKKRAMDSQNSSTICVSKWEYEYLMKKAELAKEVADKKVTAINAWIETVKAQEKEILLKSELIEKEIKKMRVLKEEEEVCNMEEVMDSQNTIRKEAKELSYPMNLSSEKSVTRSRRCSKARRVSAMQGMKSVTQNTSSAIKRRKREKPASLTLLRRRNGRTEQNDVDFDAYASFLLAYENNHRK